MIRFKVLSTKIYTVILFLHGKIGKKNPNDFEKKSHKNQETKDQTPKGEDFFDTSIVVNVMLMI